MSDEAPRASEPGDDRNRDDQQRSGVPPRSAYVPPGEKDSAQSDKTQTDPTTGEPHEGAPEPARSQRDQQDGPDGPLGDPPRS